MRAANDNGDRAPSGRLWIIEVQLLRTEVVCSHPIGDRPASWLARGLTDAEALGDRPARDWAWAWRDVLHWADEILQREHVPVPDEPADPLLVPALTVDDVKELAELSGEPGYVAAQIVSSIAMTLGVMVGRCHV